MILFWAWLGCDANSTCVQVTFSLYVNIVELLRHYNKIMIFFLFIITANPTREEIEECSRKFESQSMYMLVMMKSLIMIYVMHSAYTMLSSQL